MSAKSVSLMPRFLEMPSPHTHAETFLAAAKHPRTFTDGPGDTVADHVGTNHGTEQTGDLGWSVLDAACAFDLTPGCTDATACNYSADANTDDGHACNLTPSARAAVLAQPMSMPTAFVLTWTTASDLTSVAFAMVTTPLAVVAQTVEVHT